MDGHDHDHDHSELSETQIRVRALESVLVEKGYVDPAALDELVETYETKVGPHNGARVVAKSWVDPDYRRLALRGQRGGDRVARLHRAPGREPAGAGEHAADPQHGRLHPVLLLPVAGARAPARLVQGRAVPLARRRPIRAACCATSASSCRRTPRSACGTRPRSCATSSSRCARQGTDGWSEEELAELVTRDAMIGTGLARTPAEAAA